MRRILKDEYLKNCHDKFGNKYEYLDIIKHGKYIFVKLKCDKHGIFNLEELRKKPHKSLVCGMNCVFF